MKNFSLRLLKNKKTGLLILVISLIIISLPLITFAGTKTKGQACPSGDTDCTSNLFCDIAQSPQTCQTKLGLNQSCQTSRWCSSGNCKKVSASSSIKKCAAATVPANSSSPRPSTSQSSYTLPNFLGADNPSTVIGRVIQFIIGLSGSLALIFFIYGGVLWLISAGREDYVKKGTKVMLWAAIGLVIVFASYILVKFALSLFPSAVL